MCGIFSILNSNGEIPHSVINDGFQKGENRGPEFSKLTSIMIKAMFGFHRLAINGLNEESNQPIIINDVALICNGEIYNYKELYKLMNVEPTTDSDCEVIVHLYKKYGIDHTLSMLDGVFSFLLIDYRLNAEYAKMYIARDPYGVRPLYYLRPDIITNFTENGDDNIFAFASEMKMLTGIRDFYNVEHKGNFFKKKREDFQNYDIHQFEPGTYSIFELSFKVNSNWKPIQENIRFHRTGFQSIMQINDAYSVSAIFKNIQIYLYNAVEKRCCTTDRPIACLLSGGLDSSLITALVNEYHTINNLPKIETYSIGLKDSEDLKYARIVADYLGTKHTEIVVTEEDFLNAIPDVIYAIESYDTTSVRASIGNWLLGKYISEHSEAKVIFNGDGSDELMGGYLYMGMAPDAIEFDKECRRLLKDIHAFDVLRSDKSISSHGLEPRTPFLDRAWTQYYLSIPCDIRFHTLTGSMEKSLLRVSFSEKMYLNSQSKPLLPNEIMWRKKEAFSDGVSKHSRSLYEIIQEHTDKLFAEDELKHYPFLENSEDVIEKIAKISTNFAYVQNYLLPQTSEQYYYRKIFEQHYSGLGKVVPYFWMPKYVNAKDASARTLEIYNKTPVEESDE